MPGTGTPQGTRPSALKQPTVKLRSKDANHGNPEGTRNREDTDSHGAKAVTRQFRSLVSHSKGPLGSVLMLRQMTTHSVGENNTHLLSHGSGRELKRAGSSAFLLEAPGVMSRPASPFPAPRGCRCAQAFIRAL